MADNSQLLGLFSPETGTKVSRFGAALGGKLGQFDTAQEARKLRTTARETKLSDARKKALMVDNRGVKRLLEAGDVPSATKLLQNRIANIGKLGGDPKDTVGLLSQITSGDVKGALSEVTQLDNFAIDSGILEDTLAREKFELDKKKLAAESGLDANIVVKASEILPDGTTIQSTSKGVRVFNAQGEKLEGEAVVNAIENANKLGVTIAGDTAAAKAAADQVKQGIKISGELFEKVGPIRQSLRTISKARQAIADGAQTGVIDKFLPDIKEASIKLTNIMNQLGLEVVSGTTFGALSAGELRLALDTALPTGLQPEALDRWLSDKSVAQEKLLGELISDINTLSDGGTVADIVNKRKNPIVDRQGRNQTVTPRPAPQPTLTAGPKPISEMSIEELNAELARVRGK
jgi:hypothetical protein